VNLLVVMLLVAAVAIILWVTEVNLGSKTKLGRNAGVRLTGPMMSVSASGTFGKAITYAVWKGRAYARTWFRPENPQTPKQVNTRNALVIALAYFQATLGEAQKDAYEAAAAGLGMSGYNLYMRRVLNVYKVDPGNEVPPVAVTVVGNYPVEVITWNPV